MTSVAQVENQIMMFTLNEQLSLMEYLAKAIRTRTEQSKADVPKRYFGCAKGDLSYLDDIDFCNDEVAEMFGVNE